jgi:Fe-S oxidoreductase
LFQDEFTSFLDAGIGNKALNLLERLGYTVIRIPHGESGRSAFSKGMLKRARKCAEDNVSRFSGLVTEDCPLVGIEPSAILGFRDEYPDLVRGSLRQHALDLAPNCLTLEEFLWREMQEERVSVDAFTNEPLEMVVHGHCHGKALAGMEALMGVLNFPRQFKAVALKTGCCGMAGSFGYEREHYELSMKVGELVLFPEIRSASPSTSVVASGTSCRHQILDGTGNHAVHPAEILLQALKPEV